MKKFIVLITLILAALACSQSTPPAEAPTSVPAQVATAPPADITTDTPTTLPEPVEPTATLPPTSTPFPGLSVSFGNVTLVIPPGLASGVSGIQQPAILNDQQGAPWELTPGHLQLSLEGYVLADKFHQPRLLVYPAEAYAALNEGVANNLSFLKGVCCRAANVPDPASLPHIPFFNAGQIFSSNIQIIPFQNGSGVRFLTEYAQYFATVNNTDLFYHYQGLTEDGQFYIIAILPITAPLLAADANPESTVPAGGIVPPPIDDPNADWSAYYSEITNLLNATAPDAFAPTLAQLDALIRSIQITP